MAGLYMCPKLLSLRGGSKCMSVSHSCTLFSNLANLFMPGVNSTHHECDNIHCLHGGVFNNCRTLLKISFSA